MFLSSSSNAIVSTWVLLTLTVYRGCESVSVGQSAPLAFFNITPDTREIGFIQIFACTPNMSIIHLESLTGLNTFDVITTLFGQFYNATYDYNQLKVVNATSIGNSYVSQLGLILSSSTDDVRVFGVKSDRGTSDGFLALPITLESTEFFIAGWRCSDTMFYAAFQVIATFGETCVEVYRIINGTQYQRTRSIYMENEFDVYLYVADVGEDLTGLYVNSTKPVSILSGHSCAFIPERVYFCDHIVEQIPPINELGTTHIVPPIRGRSDLAGYIVRVVATDLSTTINWESNTGSVSGQSVVDRGQFVHIVNTHASDSMLVTCDKPCLIMQYNTGRQNVPSGMTDTPTDPFMMNIAAVNHFDNKVAFATASFFQVVNTASYKIDFNNFVAIVARSTDINAVRFDGQALSAATSWIGGTSWGYSIAVFPISHGGHVVTVVSPSTAVFGVYCYGHSPIDSSSGAYGYTVAFKMVGSLVSALWQQSQEILVAQSQQSQAQNCQQERIFSGSAVTQYPTYNDPSVVLYPFNLDVTVQSPPMSETCREQYRAKLAADLLDLSRRVNVLLCNLTMCPDVMGPAGSGSLINTSVPIVTYSREQVVYVAIDTAHLTNPVTFDIDTSTGAITTIHVVVPYTGIMDTTAESFAGCRVLIRAFMRQFINWNSGIQLIQDLPGCPRITFFQPYEFMLRQNVCPIM